MNVWESEDEGVVAATEPQDTEEEACEVDFLTAGFRKDTDGGGGSDTGESQGDVEGSVDLGKGTVGLDAHGEDDDGDVWGGVEGCGFRDGDPEEDWLPDIEGERLSFSEGKWCSGCGLVVHLLCVRGLKSEQKVHGTVQ
jgi:hypothetical protein